VKLWKLHFSRSLSSAIFTWSLKLVVDRDSMGPSLRLAGARFLNSLLRKMSHEFKLCGCQYYRTWISNGHISLMLEAMVTWSGMLVVLYVLHRLIWPSPDPKSRSRSLTFWSSANCTFLRWHHQNSLPFVSALAEARSLWLWLHIGRNKPVHAGGDDCQLPCGGFLVFIIDVFENVVRMSCAIAPV